MWIQSKVQKTWIMSLVIHFYWNIPKIHFFTILLLHQHSGKFLIVKKIAVVAWEVMKKMINLKIFSRCKHLRNACAQLDEQVSTVFLCTLLRKCTKTCCTKCIQVGRSAQQVFAFSSQYKPQMKEAARWHCQYTSVQVITTMATDCMSLWAASFCDVVRPLEVDMAGFPLPLALQLSSDSNAACRHRCRSMCANNAWEIT